MAPELRRQRLEAERSQLLASLLDAAAEHDQGELDEASFLAIDERDRQRLAEVEAELAALEREDRERGEIVPAPPVLSAAEEPARVVPSWLRRHRLSLVLGLLVLILAGALSIVVFGSSSSSSSSIPGLLAAADADVQQNKLAEALQLYSKVLSIDPTQPQALAQTGWLTFEAGVAAHSNSLISRAESEVRASVAADPNLFASRLYLGAILLVADNNPTAALEQFKIFLDLKPPADWVKQAQPYIDKAAASAGVPVPTTLP